MDCTGSEAPASTCAMHREIVREVVRDDRVRDGRIGHCSVKFGCGSASDFVAPSSAVGIEVTFSVVLERNAAGRRALCAVSVYEKAGGLAWEGIEATGSWRSAPRCLFGGASTRPGILYLVLIEDSTRCDELVDNSRSWLFSSPPVLPLLFLETNGV